MPGPAVPRVAERGQFDTWVESHRGYVGGVGVDPSDDDDGPIWLARFNYFVDKQLTDFAQFDPADWGNGESMAAWDATGSTGGGGMQASP